MFGVMDHVAIISFHFSSWIEDPYDLVLYTQAVEPDVQYRCVHIFAFGSRPTSFYPHSACAQVFLLLLLTYVPVL